MGQLKVVVGGQAGSEAKGACTAFLARQARTAGRDVTVIRVAGPNAGHTAYDDQGRKWALRQVPVAAVTDLEAMLVIAAGSEIDFPVLLGEVDALEAAGIPVRGRLLVDLQATLIYDTHKEAEAEGQLTAKLGSTAKGIGAARAERLMRRADIVADRTEWFTEHRILAVDTAADLYDAVTSDNGAVLIEGTQGYVLGLHAGYYPQCTSSNCRAIDFLGMAGIDPHWVAREDYEVWVVMRTYPIRVAGNSGPLAGETSWTDLGLPEELTTVTQKVRRVGMWNPDWASDAVVANGGSDVVRISLSMADHVVPSIAEATSLDGLGESDLVELYQLVNTVEETSGARVALVGTGPKTFIDLDGIAVEDIADAALEATS